MALANEGTKKEWPWANHVRYLQEVIAGQDKEIQQLKDVADSRERVLTSRVIQIKQLTDENKELKDQLKAQTNQKVTVEDLDVIAFPGPRCRKQLTPLLVSTESKEEWGCDPVTIHVPEKKLHYLVEQLRAIINCQVPYYPEPVTMANTVIARMKGQITDLATQVENMIPKSG